MLSLLRALPIISGVLLTAIGSGPAVAKGPVDVIELYGPPFERGIAILEGEALLDFDPWGQAFLGAPLDDPPTEVSEPLTVTMYIKDSAGVAQPVYRFAYHALVGGGLIYLPGPGDPDYDLNKGTILGGSGNWFEASKAWNALVAGLAEIQPPATGSGGLK